MFRIRFDGDMSQANLKLYENSVFSFNNCPVTRRPNAPVSIHDNNGEKISSIDSGDHFLELSDISDRNSYTTAKISFVIVRVRRAAPWRG